MITSAQAPQAGEHPDPSACCLAPTYPNVPAPAGATPAPTAGTSTTESSTSTTETEEPATTKYTEESVLSAEGGGKVGLLLISPLVLPGTVEETEYANHFTLLKTLETMFGVEPLGYAGEEEVPTLSPELFSKKKPKPSGRRREARAPRGPTAPRGRAGRCRATCGSSARRSAATGGRRAGPRAGRRSRARSPASGRDRR